MNIYYLCWCRRVRTPYTALADRFGDTIYLIQERKQERQKGKTRSHFTRLERRQHDTNKLERNSISVKMFFFFRRKSCHSCRRCNGEFITSACKKAF